MSSGSRVRRGRDELSAGDALLPLAKVRELLRLVGETFEIAHAGGDPLEHIAENVLRLAGGEIGVLAPLPRVVSPQTRDVPLVFSEGWPGWIRCEMQASYQTRGTDVDPAAIAVLQGAQSRGSMIRTRVELVDDRTWNRLSVADQYRSWRLNDSIYGGIKAGDGSATGMAFFRSGAPRRASSTAPSLRIRATCGDSASRPSTA